MELFVKIINSQRLKLIFAKAPSQIFDTIVNTLLTTVFSLLALKKFNIFSFVQKRIQQPVETFGKSFLAKIIIFAKILHRSFNTPSWFQYVLSTDLSLNEYSNATVTTSFCYTHIHTQCNCDNFILLHSHTHAKKDARRNQQSHDDR